MGSKMNEAGGGRPRSLASEELSGLMQRVAARDAASLRTLYERTSGKLYGICLRLLGDETEAQDVLQEVYVTVWQKARMFESVRASPISWLATIARNRAIDRLRARRPGTEEIEAANDVVDERTSSIDIVEEADDAARLRRCMEQLDERARTMIRAAFFDGASYPELARREHVPLPTMKSWIRRGLQRLRGCLEQ
jgi:RNA polymerase sigma-70 factor (ECF subfamily)